MAEVLVTMLNANVSVYPWENPDLFNPTSNKALFGDDYIDRDYVCIHPNGAPIRPDYVTPHFQQRLKEIGIPVTRFHDLRHSAVYALRQGGCDAKDIPSMAGS